MEQTLHAVTGAFGYSGKYIAKHLLDRGYEVITLTNSPNRENPFAGRVKPFPFNFDNPEELTKSLRGVSVLYNTYWVRFNHKLFKHTDAVRNTERLFEAAKEANVERIVHISITNPSGDSPLEYFSGKARLERALADSGISHAILRPTVLFGKEDILINNIAWILRHLPVFGVFGNGEYHLQPIYVNDIAALAVEMGAKRDNVTIDAIGPETFTYRELVKVIGETIGIKRPLISVPPAVGYFTSWILGKFIGDVIITQEEIKGLMADLLHVDSPPVGTTRLTDWMREHADSLGRRYTSELARRKDTTHQYQSN
ncbi:MAG: NAD(P)H-binding protein [Anaerolineales bacterium]